MLTLVLAILLGIFGVHSFYLGYKRNGLVALAISAVTIGGGGSILFFSGALPNALAFLIPYFVLEALMIAFSVIYMFRADLRDARGEFLR